MLCFFLFPGIVPLFAVIAAILVVQPSVNQSLGKAFERCVGVVVGVVLAYLVGIFFGASHWIILISVIAALFCAWFLRLGPASSVQIPISALLVLSLGVSTPDYALHRIFETILGALIGVIINVLIVAPVVLEPAEEAVGRLGKEVAAVLDSLAEVLARPSEQKERHAVLIQARLLTPMRVNAQTALSVGEESLRYNPRGFAHRHLLHRDGELLSMLAILVTRVAGMARAVTDHYDDSLYREPIMAEIVDEMQRASHDLRLVIMNADLPGISQDLTLSESPTLTEPLMAINPRSEHWVLMGSLLEDLRRIHEELVAATPSPTSERRTA